MRKTNLIRTVGILLLLIFFKIAEADTLVWKTTFISAMPARANVPVEFCQQFSPDVYVAPVEKLLRESVTTENGLQVKYRNLSSHQQDGLFFTEITGIFSKTLRSGHPWFTYFYIHEQMLTPHGVADGVWSTENCKGRLIAQPMIVHSQF